MTNIRLITGLVFLPLIIFLVQLGGVLYFWAVLLSALVATWEFMRMMNTRGHHPNLFLSLIFVITVMIATQMKMDFLIIPAIILLIMIGLIWQLFQSTFLSTVETSVIDWALTVVGSIYIGLGMSYFLGLRLLPDGYIWVWVVFACTWGNDTCAYFGGRAFGRHKFWPRLSPKKTWEGIMAGFIGSILGGGLVFILFEISIVHILVLAMLASIIGPLGDLSVSMMKRYVGVKDSSKLIPGHGGILDRIDSLLFVLIAVFYYVTWVT